MNLIQHLWQLIDDPADRYRDLKKLSTLKNTLDNMQKAHAKLYVNNPFCQEAKALQEAIGHYQQMIDELAEKYPNWKQELFIGS